MDKKTKGKQGQKTRGQNAKRTKRKKGPDDKGTTLKDKITQKINLKKNKRK